MMHFSKHLGSLFLETGVTEQEFWETILHLLSESERIAIELSVEKKMEESTERILVDWSDEEARRRLTEVLSTL